jgi:hypothetical protein
LGLSQSETGNVGEKGQKEVSKQVTEFNKSTAKQAAQKPLEGQYETALN